MLDFATLKLNYPHSVSLPSSVAYIEKNIYLFLCYSPSLLFNLEVNTQLITLPLLFYTKKDPSHGSPWQSNGSIPLYIVADMLAFNGKRHPKYLITLFI